MKWRIKLDGQYFKKSIGKIFYFVPDTKEAFQFKIKPVAEAIARQTGGTLELV